MSPTEVGGAIVLILGAVTGLLAATGQFSAERRKARAERLRENSGSAAVLLSSWKELGDSITAEVERVKRSCVEELTKLRTEHEQDRQEWHAEKAAMQEEIDTLKAQVYALMNARLTKRTRRTDQGAPE